MPVPNSIDDLDTVAANNSPPGTESAKGNIDNYLRAAFAFIKQAYIKGTPAGVVSYTAASSAPTGWLKCNGQAVSRSTYSDLFSAIGTTYGAGDGATTFNVPDLRGEFIRSLDDGRGIDASRALGSAQSGQNASHTHGVTDLGHAHSVSDPGHSHSVNDPGHSHANNSGDAGSGGNLGSGNANSIASRNGIISATTGVSINGTTTGVGIVSNTTGISVQSSGGAEVRPRNVALLAIIKA